MYGYCNILYCSEVEMLVSGVLQDGRVPSQDVALNKRLYYCVCYTYVHMAGGSYRATATQHLEYRHLTSGQNNLPDCQNFGRLRWLLYYFYTYRQFRGKFKSAALPKPHFLTNKVRKKCSECTDVATHRTRDVCSSTQQHHSSISSTSLTNVITQQRTLRTMACQSTVRRPHDTRAEQKSFWGTKN